MGRENRIYILPTGFGLTFICGALVMILVGATFQNNLVNMLAFFMMSLVFIAMVQTHNNLKDVALEQLQAEGTFAGDDYLVTIILNNKAQEPRFNLESRLRRAKPVSTYENVHPLFPKSSLKLKTTYASQTRGRYLLKGVRVSAVFPFGLFRAWIILPGEAPLFVYPQPLGSHLPARTGSNDDAQGSFAMRGGDDFYGHRRFERGDTPSHIDWRARAKGRPLLIKEFNQGSPAPLVFDWYALESLDTEARLSQLTLWVHEAVQRRETFGLRLPSQTIAAGQGPGHAQRCFETLAVFDGGKRAS